MTAAQPPEPNAPKLGAVVARELTASGIARALRFLADVRADPAGPPAPPRDLLFHNRYSRPFANAPTLEPRAFATRREVGEYLSPRLAPIKRQIVDRASFWSWLGIFYFEGTVRVVDGTARLSAGDETVVIDPGDPLAARSIHSHYLRSARAHPRRLPHVPRRADPHPAARVRPMDRGQTDGQIAGQVTGHSSTVDTQDT